MEPIQAQPPGMALMESKVKLLLDMHNKKLDSKFVEMQDTITALAQELQQTKAQLGKFQEQKAGKVVQVVKETQQALPPAQEKKEELHPKRGGFQPGDIQIDKVFYCGSG
jgi:hypothetical protein